MDIIKLQIVFQKISELSSDVLELDPNIFTICNPSFTGNTSNEFLIYLKDNVFKNVDSFLNENEDILGKELSNKIWESRKYPKSHLCKEYSKQFIKSNNNNNLYF